MTYMYNIEKAHCHAVACVGCACVWEIKALTPKSMKMDILWNINKTQRTEEWTEKKR